MTSPSEPVDADASPATPQELAARSERNWRRGQSILGGPRPFGARPGATDTETPCLPVTDEAAGDEHRLLDWLETPPWPDLIATGQAQDVAEPVTHLLGRLSAATERLPVASASLLGLPTTTTLGEAAVALLLAVKDPAGPRCRSYRSAIYYLHDLDDPLRPDPDGPQPPAPSPLPKLPRVQA